MYVLSTGRPLLLLSFEETRRPTVGEKTSGGDEMAERRLRVERHERAGSVGGEGESLDVFHVIHLNRRYERVPDLHRIFHFSECVGYVPDYYQTRGEGPSAE